MKIAIVSNFKIGAPNGASRFSDSLSKWFSRTNDVLYITLGDELNIRKEGRMTIFELPSIATPTDDMPICSPKPAKKLFETLDEFNPDIVHINTIVFNGVLVLNWAAERKRPVLYTLHNIPTEAAKHSVPALGELTRLIQKGYSVHLSKLFENIYVHALNEAARESALEINPKTKIFQQNLFIDTKKFENLKPKVPQKKKRFFFIGTYGKRKNQLFLTKVFKQLPKEYELVMYGAVHDKRYFSKIEKFVKDNKISNIQINKTVANGKVPELLEDMDYYVTASTHEVQSIAVIEALASATPVIGLANVTVEELVDDSVGKKLKSEASIKEFIQAIKEMTALNQAEYIKLAANAKEKSKNFEIDIVGAKFLDLYADCIKDYLENVHENSKIYLDTLNLLTKTGCGLVSVLRLLK